MNPWGLTDSECSIMWGLWRSKNSNKHLARDEFLSLRGVEHRLTNIYKKMGLDGGNKRVRAMRNWLEHIEKEMEHG